MADHPAYSGQRQAEPGPSKFMAEPASSSSSSSRYPPPPPSPLSAPHPKESHPSLDYSTTSTSWPKRGGAIPKNRRSCWPCRKRKSKCDGALPCSSCTLRDTHGLCEYPDPSKPPVEAPAKRKDETRPKKSRRKDPAPGGSAGSPAFHGSEEPDDFEEVDQDSGDEEDYAAVFARMQKDLHRLRRKMELKQDRQDTYAPSSSHSKHHIGQGLLQLRAHPDPLPPRDAALIDSMTAIFPSQADCEILFEYLLQEADWFVSCVPSQWLLPIWSRFVYGGRVRRGEAQILAVALSVACLLLKEAPHLFYPISRSVTQLGGSLIDGVVDYLEGRVRVWGSMSRRDFNDKDSLLDDLIVLGLLFDHMRIAGNNRYELWSLMQRSYVVLCSRIQVFTEEESLWSTFDDLERETARRALWQTILCERWKAIYGNGDPTVEIREDLIKLKHPDWLPGHLTAAFSADTASAGLDCSPSNRTIFRIVPSSSSEPHFHRVKSLVELQETQETLRLIFAMGIHGPDIGSYIGAVKAWQASRLQQGRRSRASASGSAASPASTHSTSGDISAKLDHRREALLHQGLALSRELKAWRDSIKYVCPMLTSFEDPTDFYACRRANRQWAVHIGVFQLLNAILTPWLSEEDVWDGGLASMPLLLQLQRQAYDNAKEVVSTLDAVKTLMTSGRILFVVNWTAYTFFSAATTLAVPLLGAARIKTEAKGAIERRGKIGLVDRYTDVGAGPEGQGLSTACFTTYNMPDGRPITSTYQSPSQVGDASIAAPSPSSSTMLLFDQASLRSLASDILRILELLPIFKASALGEEAKDRLDHLVNTYKIRSHATEPRMPPGPSTIFDVLHPAEVNGAAPVGNLTSTAGMTSTPSQPPLASVFLDPFAFAWTNPEQQQQPPLSSTPRHHHHHHHHHAGHYDAALHSSPMRMSVHSPVYQYQHGAPHSTTSRTSSNGGSSSASYPTMAMSANTPTTTTTTTTTVGAAPAPAKGFEMLDTLLQMDDQFWTSLMASG